MTRQEYRALTLKAEPPGLLRVIASDCFVCAAFDPQTTPAHQRPPFEKFTAIWDTGATGSVITQSVVAKCGLKAHRLQRVHHVGGVDDAEVFLVNMGLPSNVNFARIEVTKGAIFGADVLIGMDIITTGDVTISNKNGHTVFSFRVPSLGAVDYVEHYNQQPPPLSQEAQAQIRQAQEIGSPELHVPRRRVRRRAGDRFLPPLPPLLGVRVHGVGPHRAVVAHDEEGVIAGEHRAHWLAHFGPLG